MGAVVLLGLVVLLFAVQTWRVIDAIGRAQDAVVPLPSRVAEVPAAPTSAPLPGPPALSGAPLPVATAPAGVEPAEVSGADQPSVLSVAGRVLEAGLDRGDPGRAAVWEGRTALTILVLGVDRRPDGGDQNADVIILARLDLVEKRLSAVSLPRDLLVEIPGVGPDRINSAYNYGALARPDDPAAGAALVRDTLEANFGLPIDDYVLVDFAGFEEVVDAVGGIEVDVPAPIHDPAFPSADYGTEVVAFAAGRQHMDGERALQYARTRNADSDDERRDRQLQVLLALFDRGKRLDSVARADKLILALGDAVQTGFDLDEQLLLARVGLATDRADIRLTTLAPPLIQASTTESGAWVYVADPAALAEFVHAALATEPAPAQP